MKYTSLTDIHQGKINVGICFGDRLGVFNLIRYQKTKLVIILITGPNHFPKFDVRYVFVGRFFFSVAVNLSSHNVAIRVGRFSFRRWPRK